MNRNWRNVVKINLSATPIIGPLQWTSPLTPNPTYGVTAWNLPASVVGHFIVQGGSNDAPAP